MDGERKYHLKQSFQEAELKARTRDFSNQVNLEEVARQERKANEMGFGLYRRKQQNKVPFSMVMGENLEIIIQSSYLTTKEYGFLYKLQPYIAMGSNALRNKNDEFMTVSELANNFKMTRTSVATTLNGLIEKGLIYELVPSQEIKEYKRVVNARPLFLNPEINARVDRNRIDPVLCDMVMQYDYLEKNKILLPYKVWHSNGERFGKLITRKRYLELKREQKKSK